LPEEEKLSFRYFAEEGIQKSTVPATYVPLTMLVPVGIGFSQDEDSLVE